MPARTTVAGTPGRLREARDRLGRAPWLTAEQQVWWRAYLTGSARLDRGARPPARRRTRACRCPSTRCSCGSPRRRQRTLRMAELADSLVALAQPADPCRGPDGAPRAGRAPRLRGRRPRDQRHAHGRRAGRCWCAAAPGHVRAVRESLVDRLTDEQFRGARRGDGARRARRCRPHRLTARRSPRPRESDCPHAVRPPSTCCATARSTTRPGVLYGRLPGYHLSDRGLAMADGASPTHLSGAGGTPAARRRARRRLAAAPGAGDGRADRRGLRPGDRRGRAAHRGRQPLRGPDLRRRRRLAAPPGALAVPVEPVPAVLGRALPRAGRPDDRRRSSRLACRRRATRPWSSATSCPSG